MASINEYLKNENKFAGSRLEPGICILNKERKEVIFYE